MDIGDWIVVGLIVLVICIPIVLCVWICLEIKAARQMVKGIADILQWLFETFVKKSKAEKSSTDKRVSTEGE